MCVGINHLEREWETSDAQDTGEDDTSSINFVCVCCVERGGGRGGKRAMDK